MKAEMQPLPALACPVCGEPNECAAAGSGSFATPCWCAALAVDPAALARAPAQARNRACLCRKCLSFSAPARDALHPEERK
jgi:hypothetical protein